jgi:hypothetical protein
LLQFPLNHHAVYVITTCTKHPMPGLACPTAVTQALLNLLPLYAPGVLQMLQHCAGSYDIKFRHYAQSSRCLAGSDSSVSYAAATVIKSSAAGR